MGNIDVVRSRLPNYRLEEYMVFACVREGGLMLMYFSN